MKKTIIIKNNQLTHCHLKQQKVRRATLALSLFFTFFAAISWGQIATYNFQDVVFASGVNANITAGNVSISTGSISYQNGTDDGGTKIGFNASWPTGNFNTSGKYLQYTIAPNSGYQIDFSELRFRFGRTAQGPQKVTVQISTDGFATAGTTIINDQNVTSTNVNLLDSYSVTAGLPTNFIGTLTVRIWGHNASGTGNLRFNNFKVFGTVTSTASNTITTGTVATTPFNLANCSATASGTVAFTSTGTFNAGNTYTAQLSDASGNFGSPTNIGTLSSTANNGTINITIPAGTGSGTAYKIRVISSNPSVTGTESTAFTINQSGTCATASTDYFRSKTNGNWNATSTWESSSNNINWINATLTPTSAANTITIRNGHTVNITANVTIDQTVIDAGAQLNWTGGVLTLNNGTGDELDIYGVFNNNITAKMAPPPSATIRIRTAGILRVSGPTVTGVSGDYAGANSNGIFIYEHGAIFDWNTTSFFESANQTYFPSAAATVIPIFRNSLASGPVGANSNTTINGIFESNENITWQNSGVKTFRNGITGTGNVTQAASCGQFQLTGTTAYLGGGSINLNSTVANANRLQTNGTVYVELLSNKVINGNTGSQLRITDPSTLDAKAFQLSGSANLQLNSDATLITQHANGVQGSVGSLASVIYETPNRQNIIFERNGTQNAGLSALNGTLGSVLVRNGSKLTLQKDLSIENKTAGSFIVDGAGSEVGATSNVTININGNRFFTLQNGGSMNDNALDYITFTTGGITSTGTFTGNGNTIKCWNFEPVKTTSGGVTLSTNTPFTCKNNFDANFAGTAVFTDNGNTITVGDDIKLAGANSSNYNFTGTFIMNGAGTGLVNTIQNGNDAPVGHINNLIIQTPIAKPNVQINPQSGSQTTTIKGHLTINSGVLLAHNNTINLGGNWVNNVGEAAFTEGNSTINFNGATAQTITCNASDEQFHNMIINNTAGVTLNNHATVKGQLTLTSGKFNTGNCGVTPATSPLLTMTAGSTVSGGNNASHVNGVMRKIGNTAFTFPIGNGTYYAPLAITATISATDEFTACYQNANPTVAFGTAKASNVKDVTDCEYWQLNSVPSNLSTEITLDINANRCASSTPPFKQVVRWSGAEWQSLGDIDLTSNEVSSDATTQRGPITWASETRPTMSGSTCGTYYDVEPGELIFADPVVNATNYRFRVEDEDGNIYFIVDADGSMTINLFAKLLEDYVADPINNSLGEGFQYDQTYTISVEAFVNGDWSGFGESCDIYITDDPRTKLRADFCDATISALDTRIFVDRKPLFTSYNYQIKNLSTNTTVNFTRTDPQATGFRLTQDAASIAAYNTTYEVRVTATYGSFTTNLGTTCTITTPQTVKLRNCGTIINPVLLTSLNQVLYSEIAFNATEYQFEVTSSEGTEVITKVGSSNWSFSLSELTTLPLTLNTNYSIKVRAKVGNSYLPYGDACVVKTPGNATTKLTNLYCGQSGDFKTLYATRVAGATGYIFEVKNNNTNSVIEISHPNVANNFFHLSNHTPAAFRAGGSSFTIRVKVKVGTGNYGAYDDPCVYTILSQNSGENGLATIDHVVAYPNPFTSQFTVSFTDLTPATIHVFDIQGRLVESVSTNETFEVEMGQNLNTGVYLVRVEQNNEITSFKMIKK